jgi:hypothetical protein
VGRLRHPKVPPGGDKQGLSSVLGRGGGWGQSPLLALSSQGPGGGSGPEEDRPALEEGTYGCGQFC